MSRFTTITSQISLWRERREAKRPLRGRGQADSKKSWCEGKPKQGPSSKVGRAWHNGIAIGTGAPLGHCWTSPSVHPHLYLHPLFIALQSTSSKNPLNQNCALWMVRNGPAASSPEENSEGQILWKWSEEIPFTAGLSGISVP